MFHRERQVQGQTRTCTIKGMWKLRLHDVSKREFCPRAENAVNQIILPLNVAVGKTTTKKSELSTTMKPMNVRKFSTPTISWSSIWMIHNSWHWNWSLEIIYVFSQIPERSVTWLRLTFIKRRQRIIIISRTCDTCEYATCRLWRLKTESCGTSTYSCMAAW